MYKSVVSAGPGCRQSFISRDHLYHPFIAHSIGSALRPFWLKLGQYILHSAGLRKKVGPEVSWSPLAAMPQRCFCGKDMIGRKTCKAGMSCPRYTEGRGQWHVAVHVLRRMSAAERDERYPCLRLIELECHVARMSNKRTSRKQAENLRASSHQSSSSSAAPRILLDPNRRDPGGPITPSGPVPIGAKFTGLEADLPPTEEGTVWGSTDV